MDNAVEVKGQGAALTIGERINVTWGPLSVIDNELFEIDTPKVDISLLRYKEDDGEWEKTAVLATDLPNNGRASVTLPNIQPLDQSQPFNLALIQVTLNASTSIAQSSRMKRSIPDVLRSLKQSSKALALQVKEEVSHILKSCREWYLDDEGIDERSILPCPCRKEQVEKNQDPRYTEEAGFWADIARKFFHPKAASCYRQRW